MEYIEQGHPHVLVDAGGVVIVHISPGPVQNVGTQRKHSSSSNLSTVEV